MRRLLQRAVLICGLAACAAPLLLLAPAPLDAQVRVKRLILKDGSYQPASKWEIKGERVRYYSAERYTWEELPNSLIDWPATEKYNTELAAGSAEARAADAEAEAERARQAAASPLVAPGLRLPGSGGVFLLDTWRGEPSLVELLQSGGEVNPQRGKNVLRAVLNPIATARQSIELKGVKAAVQSHSDDPVFFANIDAPATPADAPAGDSVAGAGRFRIVRVQPRKDTRVVATLKIGLTGRTSEEQSFLPATTQPVPGTPWVKIVPAARLVPGEYALVEMLGPRQMNLYVWDFGMHPDAPLNRNAMAPLPPP